jgi:hypothetical protein
MEVTGGWRSLHNEEMHNFYSSQNIVIVMKLRKMKWAWHVATTGKVSSSKILVRKPEGRDRVGDRGVDGKIISNIQ